MPKSLFLDLTPLKESPPFRNIVISRVISVFGIGMLLVAVPLQIYTLTGSSTQVGVAAMVTGVATLAGSLVGGVLADRYDRRMLILWSRGLCGLGFCALTANATITDPSITAIYLLGAFDGAMGAISFTALLAVTPTLIPAEKYAAAGAINGLTAEVGMMSAPALGGVIIAAGGVNWTYGIAAAGTLLTLPLLAKLPALQPKSTDDIHPMRALVGGFQFAWNHSIVRSVLIIGTLALLGSGVTALIPALVTDHFAGNPRIAGLLYSGIALGAGIGSVTSGWIAEFRRKGQLIIWAAVAGLALTATVGVPATAWLTFVTLAGAGLAVGIRGILEFTLLQVSTPDHLRGRVNSLWSALTLLGGATGSMIAGFLGSVLEPATAIAVFGGSLTVLAVAGLFGFRHLRSWTDGASHPTATTSTD